ncbi:hypothetical protein YH65_01255 [Sulfurovum lithotrophicum]|uniref:EAL domain-containing protein n=1 Tax=Sulfurovum lithotrophicum TaxID=206403 RepID=A0A7U4RPY2_9BACT|nr:EAL domain-containing protein [Sulfurovum lithotrophicum]AKF24176.1 hypothetical protein YH65_01255 [Sulfurovum lithotrophicum]
MLQSERQERGRRFELALRAGIPVVLLISLVLYAVFFHEKKVELTLENGILFASIVFISVYFIYFLINLSVNETLVDMATQGYNEKAFIAQMEAYKTRTIALLVIRNLSTISENYSTDEVDVLLYSIVHKLHNEFKKAGFGNVLIARRYGAEFLIAVDKKSEEIEHIFENFIKQNCTINNIELDYAFSMIRDIDEDIETTILHLKDLLAAQTQKKEKIPVPDAKEVSQTEAAIIEALKEKNLLLSFRPLLNVKTGKTDIYEVAVKLRSPSHKDILPREFLPIINRLGLGREYDLAIFTHILSLLPLVNDSISFSFNLSPFSLRNGDCQKKFFSFLEEASADPSRIIIELYERKTHHNLSGYLETLQKFRTKGIRIAIDNFGSSNASMEYMKHFHFDIVQFDRDYVSKLEDANTHAMLSSLVSMSKSLNITTVAKWVDSEAQKKELIALGIDYLQGFGIGKPVTEQQLIQIYN